MSDERVGTEDDLTPEEADRPHGTVQVLVGATADREALRTMLEDRYTVETDETVTDADLYLVDEDTFPEYHDALREQVEKSHPVFCPAVLIRRPESIVDVRLPDPAAREPPLIVDDIVDAPLERAPLVRRLESLLARRRQSAELQSTVLELEDMNQRLERLAGVLSHDLRNPIQVAQTRLELLESQAPSNIVTEHVKPIARAVARMAGLTDELLTFARDESDDSDRRPCDLEEIVGNAWTDTGVVAVSDATLVTDELDVAVYAERERLRQVFENLFRNAVEHAGSNVTVTVGRTPEGFFVADDGPGIAAAERGDVFTMGYSTTDDGTGNGLGLNIVEEVVADHDWRVEVDESDAGGARFDFCGVEFE